MADDFMKELADEADAAPPVTLESVRAFGAQVNAIQDEIAATDARLKELNAQKNQLLSREMVDAMDGARCPELVIGSYKFQAGAYYHASIPEENQDPAHDWLEANEAGDLIKYQLIVEFPKDCEEEAKKLEEYIRKNVQIAEVKMKRGVPWARLTSWLKELYESKTAPRTLPTETLELLGAKVGRVVKMKEVKER